MTIVLEVIGVVVFIAMVCVAVVEIVRKVKEVRASKRDNERAVSEQIFNDPLRKLKNLFTVGRPILFPSGKNGSGTVLTGTVVHSKGLKVRIKPDWGKKTIRRSLFLMAELNFPKEFKEFQEEAARLAAIAAAEAEAKRAGEMAKAESEAEAMESLLALLGLEDRLRAATQFGVVNPAVPEVEEIFAK